MKRDSPEPRDLDIIAKADAVLEALESGIHAMDMELHEMGCPGGSRELGEDCTDDCVVGKAVRAIAAYKEARK